MDQTRFIATAEKATLIYAMVFVGMTLLGVILTPGIVFSSRGVIGGDFLAFYTAGELALSGQALSAYELTSFDAAMKARADLDVLAMSWQYPPVMFLLTAPFALLPYKLAYALWIASGWIAFAAAMGSLALDRRSMRLLLFSPLCVGFISHGQINLFIAALLCLAAYAPKERWLIAGLAAGALTIKPQLGLLIPLAFIAAGAWRAIGVAALSGALIHFAGFAAFGVDGLTTFLNAVQNFKGEVTGAALATPPYGMTTLFGQLKLWGAPGPIALQIHSLSAIAIGYFVWRGWRHSNDALFRAGLLCAGAILVAPYAYGYELTALSLSAVYLARRTISVDSPIAIALISGWMLIAVEPIIGDQPWINIPFVIALSSFGLLLRAASGTNNQIEIAPVRA